MIASPTTTTLAHWYGADRGVAASIGRALDGCRWVGIPFAGGMSAVAHITARSIVCNDLHSALINYARVAADPVLGQHLYRKLRRITFHAIELDDAQMICRERQPLVGLFQHVPPDPDDKPDLEWAVAYFVTVWCARGGLAGTDSEFNQKLSFRWNANGGDSNTRFRSATQSLVAWRRILRRCNFTCMNAFEFLLKCEDTDGHGLYVDAPWPDDGDSYRHKFSEADQRKLAACLSGYRKTRVVIRFGVHPLIEQLYPSDRWHWLEQTSRAQSNGDVKEALISNQAIAGDINV